MEIRIISKEEAWQLRHTVMWPEKEPEYVRLKDDDTGAHFGLFEGGLLVSAVSLFVSEGEAQFRKFATLASHQNKGYGSRLLNHVLSEAERAGAKRIFCNARTGKAGYYEKFGLKRTEHTFTKDGKDYVVMERLTEIGGT